MIIQEHFLIGERDFVRTYSNSGVKIRGGSPEADYDEATDPAELGRTYTETDIPVDDGGVTAEEALGILLGETE